MSTIPQPQFYVYILARPNGNPFYVGKGKKWRIDDHEREARKGHKCHKCHIIRKIWRNGGDVQRYIVFTTSDEQEAFAYEKELIALHGRSNLCNQTDGGEGCSEQSLKVRSKISATMKERLSSPDAKAARSEQMKRVWANRKANPLDTFQGRLAQINRERIRNRPEYTVRGENVAGAKLTEETVREIRRLFASGDITRRELSVRFGVSKSVIERVINCQTWKHVI